jgi:ketosteroid isomerase-like protein
MTLDEAQVLAANRAFFTAFSLRDPVAMASLWCRRVPVACVHPGWQALHGRDDVLASWEAILSHPESPKVDCSNEQVHVVGDAAYVTCDEMIGESTLVATNLFFREDGEWRIAHHHSSGVADDDDDDDDDSEGGDEAEPSIPDPKLLN